MQGLASKLPRTDSDVGVIRNIDMHSLPPCDIQVAVFSLLSCKETLAQTHHSSFVSRFWRFSIIISLIILPDHDIGSIIDLAAAISDSRGNMCWNRSTHLLYSRSDFVW
jgi:hypothetical protein